MGTDTKQKPKKERPQKYMFDLYRFDEEEEEEEEEGPVPVYTEEDMALRVQKTHDDAFQKGRSEALEESRNSQEQQITKLLNRFSQELKVVVDAEKKRNKKFEQDAIRLAQATFQSLFPAMIAREGLNEIMDVVEKVISEREETAEITIHVSSKLVENMTTRVAEHHVLKSYNITVEEGPNLSHGDCKIKWAHGGAVRSASDIVENMEKEFEKLLGKSDKDDSLNEKTPSKKVVGKDIKDKKDKVAAPAPEEESKAEDAGKDDEPAVNEKGDDNE